ncbi:MAG TPA: response regulator [Granulicella sp.]|jgi:DNA-binding NtrC family response regulator|nr:response regulator [Granulicella sp.]
MLLSTNFEVIPLIDVPAEKPNLSHQARRPVILVVDDEQIIADTLTAVLCHSGFAAIAAYNGRAALDLAAVIPPELLITDIAMPKMNGIELALSVVRTIPDCKVLLFSGHASHVDLLEARKAGHYFPLLSKPLHPTEMLGEVTKALNLHKTSPAQLLS